MWVRNLSSSEWRICLATRKPDLDARNWVRDGDSEGNLSMDNAGMVVLVQSKWYAIHNTRGTIAKPFSQITATRN